MADFKLDDVIEASTLIRKGLEKRTVVSKDPEYKHLLDKAISNPDFFLLAEKVAEGLGIELLAANDFGIILTPSEINSSFTMKLSEYRKELVVENNSNKDPRTKRALLSLILIAIPATLYPTSETLEEDDGTRPRSASVTEVAQVLRRLSDKIIQSNEYLEERTYLKNGASYIQELPDTLPTQKQDTFMSLYGAISIIMKHFVEEGLLYTDDNKLYLMKQKYKVLLQNRFMGSLLENLAYMEDN